MRRLWVVRLAALLAVLLAVPCAVAEMAEDVEPGIVSGEAEIFTEQADKTIPEEAGSLLGELGIAEPGMMTDAAGEAARTQVFAPAARRVVANEAWDDGDLPIIETNVSAASENCVFLGLQGSYMSDVAGALERINEIRLEACQEGVPNPRTGEPLTMDDYRPIHWAYDLEYIARIRAAESAITMGHARLNGGSIWFFTPNGVQSWGEVIAWNGSSGMIMGINQWYEEKADWVNHTQGAVTGHYTQMISPTNIFVGLGTFLSRFAPYYNTTVGEFSSKSGLNETPMAFKGPCIQKLEVATDVISGGRILGYAEGVQGDALAFSLAATVGNRLFHVFDPVTWTSSDDSVASVDAAGIVTANFCGSAVITASASELITGSAGFTVNHIPQTDPAVPPTCTQTGLTEGAHCSVCNTVLVAQETVPAKGHDAVTDSMVPPTCTQTGLTEGAHCSVCNAVLVAQETIPAKGHTAVTDPAVSATCTQTGLTEGAHCSDCGKVLVKQKKIRKLISVRKCKITGIGDMEYTGKAIKPDPVVKYKGKTLVRNADYTVEYADNKAVGTATVRIIGRGLYGDSVDKSFKINPRPVAISSVTPGSGQLTVKWKKGKGISGYEVQYSLKKSFASAGKVTVEKASTGKTVLKNLKPKKTYYVRVRTYKTVNDKKYYSAWSVAESAKTKK